MVKSFYHQQPVRNSKNGIEERLAGKTTLRKLEKKLANNLFLKRVFYAIVGSRKLAPEFLETTFCLVGKSLNACPITSVKARPDGFEVLTPNHLLLGRNGTSFPSLSFQEPLDHGKLYICNLESLASRLGASAE